MERTRPRLGLRHLTVVPTNFEPEDRGRDREHGRERDGDAERESERRRDGSAGRPSSSSSSSSLPWYPATNAR